MRKIWTMLGSLIVCFSLVLPVCSQEAERQKPLAAQPGGTLTFTEKEVAYLKAQRVGRIATVSKKLQPDVAPVSFEFDGQHLYIGGRNNPATMKYRNVERGNTKVALVFDDWESLDPWKPRSLKIHGSAELVKRKGSLGEGTYLRITPEVKWSMGIDEPAFQEGKAVIKKETKK